MEHRNRLGMALIASALAAITGTAIADCPGTPMQTARHCLYFGNFSSLSATQESGELHPLASVSMFPFEDRPTEEDLQEQYVWAKAATEAGISFRNEIVSVWQNDDPEFVADFDCPLPDPQTGAVVFAPKCDGTQKPRECFSFREILLCDPEANYESEEYVKTDGDKDGEPESCDILDGRFASLARARDIFAYQTAIGWNSGGESPKTLLLKTIRAMADAYLIVADEFFIDAAEFRVSYNESWKLDDKLDAQTRLMTKARLCYQAAVDAFVSGFSPTLGTTLYAADFFGEVDTEDGNLFSLFNLAVERWASAWRDEASKRRARGLSLSEGDTAAAHAQFDADLRSTATQTYLLAAAIAQRDSAFPANGGPRLELALNLMRNLSLARSTGLNPLGYDDRFVPLRDFSPGLLEDARTMQANAEQSFQDFQAHRREEDTNVVSLRQLIRENNSSALRSQLASLTGVPLSLYKADSDEFDARIRTAGDDFDECALDEGDDAFAECMSIGDRASGALAAKYHDIHRARTQWRLALLQEQNLRAEIESQVKQFGDRITILKERDEATRIRLSEYLEAHSKARDIQVSETKGKSKEKAGGDTTNRSSTGRTTTTSYYLENETLGLQIEKESDIQEIMTQYQIQLDGVAHDGSIKAIERQIAEQQIQIGLAIQGENATALDFGNTIAQRDDLLFQLDQARTMSDWSVQRVMARASEARILKSRAGLQFESDFNQAVRFAYLAAKSLEYKYMRPLVNIPVGGADNLLNITDLFKIQDVVELDRFIDKLDLYDACPWGSIQFAPIELSLVWDILGYNDAYLETQAGRALTDQELEEMREVLWRGYVARNLEQDPETGRSLLRIRFSTSLTDPAIDWAGLYNAKIWWGVAPSPCDPVPTNGVAVNFDSSQPGTRWKPRVIIEQSGSNTFLTPEEEIVEYTPVGLYLNMTGENTDNMFRSRALLSDSRTGLFIGEEPNPAVAWSNGLKGRGIASPNWTLEVKDVGREPIQWHRLHDIVLYVDVIGATQ